MASFDNKSFDTKSFSALAFFFDVVSQTKKGTGNNIGDIDILTDVRAMQDDRDIIDILSMIMPRIR